MYRVGLKGLSYIAIIYANIFEMAVRQTAAGLSRKAQNSRNLHSFLTDPVFPSV